MVIFQSVFGLLFFVLYFLLGIPRQSEEALNSSWNFDISNSGYSVMDSE